MSKTYAVIGDPIGHSLSPHIQNALYARYNLPHHYKAIKVSIDQIPDFFNTFFVNNLGGCNVTMPHKQRVLEYLQEIDPAAALCQSVNTIVRDDQTGALKGYSTDAPGLRAALASHGVFYQDKSLLLLGAGGAARAIALDFAQNGGKELVVAGRTASKAQGLCSFVIQHSQIHARSVPFDAITEDSRSCDLVINATPLGMQGTAQDFTSFAFLDALPTGAFVVDLIYNPAKTALLAQAERRGLPILNGLSMLIWQSFLSFEKWFGILPDNRDYFAIKLELERLLCSAESC